MGTSKFCKELAVPTTTLTMAGTGATARVAEADGAQPAELHTATEHVPAAD
jgi:hypothetical protein